MFTATCSRMNSPVNQTNRFLMVSFLILLGSLCVNILKQLSTSGSVNIVGRCKFVTIMHLIGKFRRSVKVCKYTPNSRCPSSCCSCHAFRQYFAMIQVKCSADCYVILFQLTNYQNNSTSSPGFHGQRFSNLQPGCTFDVILISSVQYDKILSKFGQKWLVVVNYACAFKQSETCKYFE